MPRTLQLQLKRGITYRHGNITFRRGTPVTIPDEITYHSLLRTGYLIDPEQNFNYIHPNILKKAKPGQDIIVIRDMGMGDVLMVSVALRALVARWPQFKFTYAVDRRYLPLFDHCDFLKETIAITELTGRQDFVLDLRGYSERAADRNVKDRIEIFGEALGVKVEDFSFPYEVTLGEEGTAKERLKGLGVPLIGVVVRSASHLRTWPFHHVVEFCKQAVDRGWGVVLLDHESIQINAPGVYNPTGTLGLRELAAVINECDLIVSPDTGAMHLAEAVRTPCVAIFAAIDPAVRITHYQYVTAMWRGWERDSQGNKALTCCPCWERGCPDTPCLTGITPEMVIEKARGIIMNTSDLQLREA